MGEPETYVGTGVFRINFEWLEKARLADAERIRESFADWIRMNEERMTPKELERAEAGLARLDALIAERKAGRGKHHR